MRVLQTIAVLALLFPLAGCITVSWKKPEKTDTALYLQPATFEQLPGWHADPQGQAVVPLQRSCARIAKKDPDKEFGTGGFAGNAAAWQDACEKLSEAIPMTDAESRAFFEEHFIPYEIWGPEKREGLFTGYYEPILHGSFKRHGKYQIPLYGRPNDLVTVNLGDFKPALKGETITGRVTKEKVIPYYKREEIEGGALSGQKKEIVWVDNAVDAFFLHIQGSGLVRMKNGKTLRVGYAAENGQAYLAIGRELLARGALTKDNVSMQSIRAWLENHPEEAADVMNLNMSYIFFRALKNNDGPLGAEGVPLTPKRSLAVDRKKIPYGVPVWLDAEDPDGEARLQRLMVAQDTGGAITGSVRGDFFWGSGDLAAHKAGIMKSKGFAWVLLPKAVKVPPAKMKAPLWERFFAKLKT